MNVSPNSVSPEAQAVVVRIRELLQTKQRVRKWVPDFPGDPPKAIGTQSYEPDPAYDGLRNVVREKCLERGKYPECYGQLHFHTRDWTTWPKGALEGAIPEAAFQTGVAFFDRFNTALIAVLMRGETDHDLAAAEALEEALKEKP